MTNDKEYMREYQRLRRNKLSSESKKESKRYMDWSWYESVLKNNKEALKRYESYNR